MPQPDNKQFRQVPPDDNQMLSFGGTKRVAGGGGSSVISPTTRDNVQNKPSHKPPKKDPSPSELDFDVKKLNKAEAFLQESHDLKEEDISSQFVQDFLGNLLYVLGARAFRKWWWDVLKVDPSNPKAIANQTKNVRGAMLFRKGGKDAMQAWTQQIFTAFILAVILLGILLTLIGVSLLIGSSSFTPEKIERTK